MRGKVSERAYLTEGASSLANNEVSGLIGRFIGGGIGKRKCKGWFFWAQSLFARKRLHVSRDL